MFVKKKSNRSGSTTVVVVEKIKGVTHYLKTIGISSNANEISSLVIEAKKYIRHLELSRNPELDFSGAEDLEREKRLNQVKEVVSNIDKVLHDMPQQILNKVFRKIGFDAIEDNIFQQLVLARLAFPSSKKATVEYLKSHNEHSRRYAWGLIL